MIRFEGFKNSAGSDWDSDIKSTPPSSVGEFSMPGVEPVVADLNAKSFTEMVRSPFGAQVAGGGQ